MKAARAHAAVTSSTSADLHTSSLLPASVLRAAVAASAAAVLVAVAAAVVAAVVAAASAAVAAAGKIPTLSA